MSVTWPQAGFSGSADVTDLWSGAHVGTVSGSYGATLRPGETRLIRAHPLSSTVSRYEAEDATISQRTVATDHTGHNRTGFVDYTNTTGSYVMLGAGSRDIRLRGTVGLRPSPVSR